MTTGCTVVTPLYPDQAAIYQLLAEIDGDLRLYPNTDDECLEVLHPTRDATLVVVDEPRLVRVPGELQRLLGSDLGFDPGVLAGLEGLWWLDVRCDEQSAEAVELMALFSLNLAERGHGSFVEHDAGQLAFPASTIGLGLADTPAEVTERLAGRDDGPGTTPDDDEELRGNRWS